MCDMCDVDPDCPCGDDEVDCMGCDDKRELLQRVACSGVELDDSRMSYVVLQMDSDLWHEIKANYSIKPNQKPNE